MATEKVMRKGGGGDASLVGSLVDDLSVLQAEFDTPWPFTAKFT